MTARMDLDIRTILFPTDFSPHSDHAFPAALLLAQQYQARLHLLHVVHRAQEQQAARARLTSLAREPGPAAFTLAVEAGGAAHEIVKYAERERVDLIVMGSHGRTGLAHAVRGSVAESVMRHAPCLVLTIRKSAGLPVAAPQPPAEESRPSAVPAPRAGRCLVCVLPSEELICDSCRNRIQAEALYWKLRGQKVEQ